MFNMKDLYQIYNTIRNLKRIRSEMSVRSWIRHAKRVGVLVTEREIKEAMRYLQSRAYGTYFVGRHGRQCRFKWNGGADYVREMLGSEIENSPKLEPQGPTVAHLIAELEKIVMNLKEAALARGGSSSPAHVDGSANGALNAPTSLTSSLRTPTAGCFTARDVHALNRQMSLAAVRMRLNQLVISGELEVVDVKSGRVGRPVKLYAWALAEAA